MPTVIDALLVTLGLDPSDFKKGIKEVEKEQEKFGKQSQKEEKERERAEKKAADNEKKRQKELQQQRKQALDTFKKIRNQVLSLGAAFTAGKGFKDFAQAIISDTAAMGRVNQVVGMSAKELSVWGIAAENAGGSSKEMMNDILKTSNEIASFHLGRASEGIKNFLSFGGDAKTLTSAKSYLLGVSDLLSRVNKTNPSRAAVMASQMGFGFAAFNVLKQGPQLIQKNISTYENLTGVTQNQTREAQKALEQWNAMKASLEKTGRMVLFNVMPIFRELSQEIEKGSLWLSKHPDAIRAWGKEAAESIKIIVKEVEQLADQLQKLEPFINALNKVDEKTKTISPLINPAAHPIEYVETIKKIGIQSAKWVQDAFKSNRGAQGSWGNLNMTTGSAAGHTYNNRVTRSTVHSETNIKEINIHTNAKDANGIGKEIGNAVKKHNIEFQSNTGMN